MLEFCCFILAVNDSGAIVWSFTCWLGFIPAPVYRICALLCCLQHFQLCSGIYVVRCKKGTMQSDFLCNLRQNDTLEIHNEINNFRRKHRLAIENKNGRKKRIMNRPSNRIRY